MDLPEQSPTTAVTHHERLPVLPGVPPEDDGGDARDAHRAWVTRGARPPHGSRVPLGRQGQLLKTRQGFNSQHRLDTGSGSSQEQSLDLGMFLGSNQLLRSKQPRQQERQKERACVQTHRSATGTGANAH